MSQNEILAIWWFVFAAVVFGIMSIWWNTPRIILGAWLVLGGLMIGTAGYFKLQDVDSPVLGLIFSDYRTAGQWLVMAGVGLTGSGMVVSVWGIAGMFRPRKT